MSGSWFTWEMGCPENKFVVVHDKAYGCWEPQGLMRHDELKDMRCLVPMRKKAY